MQPGDADCLLHDVYHEVTESTKFTKGLWLNCFVFSVSFVAS